jgi:hypothetical protein
MGRNYGAIIDSWRNEGNRERELENQRKEDRWENLKRNYRSEHPIEDEKPSIDWEERWYREM